jgi:hypothetical protein
MAKTNNPNMNAERKIDVAIANLSCERLAKHVTSDAFVN